MGELMSNFTVMLARKEQRDNKRYTQREIAELTNSSEATISRWMKGDISGANLATVYRLCDWLDCDVGDLVKIKRETA